MQRKKDFWGSIKQMYAAYDRLMEKQGFYIVLAVCVLVIVLSALYTFHFRERWSTLETGHASQESVTAGGNQNAQSLLEAQTLIASQRVPAVPTEAPKTFAQPVDGFIDRDFSMLEPQYFAAPNYWRAHPGIDFQAEYGAVVQACAEGVVVSVRNDAEMGLCIRLRHDDDYESVYAGLSDAGYVRTGDPVSQGQTIGHVGNGVLAETDAKPHLHFEIWKGETATDPVPLFLGLYQ